MLSQSPGLTCAAQNQGRRYLKLVPVFPSEDGSGYTRDGIAERWTELNTVVIGQLEV